MAAAYQTSGFAYQGAGQFAYQEGETTGGGIGGKTSDRQDHRKRVWIEGVPYDIPIDALADVERWMPKKEIKRAKKQGRVPRIEVIGRASDGVEVRQEVKAEEWPVVAEMLVSATFIVPGILEFGEFERVRQALRRRRITWFLLMAAA